MQSLPTPTRRASPRVRWRVITLAMTSALVLYSGLLLAFRFAELIPTPPPPTATLRVLLLALGGVQLAAAIAWTLAMIPSAPPDGLPRTALEAEGQRFLTRSIVGSALAEAGGLFGFILALLGGSLTEAVLLMGLSLVVQVSLLLPRGEAYWRASEERYPAHQTP